MNRANTRRIEEALVDKAELKKGLWESSFILMHIEINLSDEGELS